MSKLDIKVTSKVVTTEYSISKEEIVKFICDDLELDPKKVTLTWVIDDGRDYNGDWGGAPKLNCLKIKVVE